MDFNNLVYNYNYKIELFLEFRTLNFLESK
jgi:hypothetical protein